MGVKFKFEDKSLHKQKTIPSENKLLAMFMDTFLNSKGNIYFSISNKK